MTDRRIWLLLALALFTGGLGFVLSLRAMEGPAAGAQARELPRTTVVVAARELPAGRVVEREDVRLLEWPGAERPTAFLGSIDEVVGRGLLTALQPGEPVLAGKLAPAKAGGGLAALIPPGMRAVSVRVDEVIGVAGFAAPGSRVDVLVTLMPRAAGEPAVTRLILQNILTLAAGRSLEAPADGDEPAEVEPVITLLVSPEQAEVLTLAATEGKIHLALRHALDHGEVVTPGARASSILNGGRAEASPRRAPGARRIVAARPASAVELILGGSRTTVRF